MDNRLSLLPRGVDDIIAKFVHQFKYELKLVHQYGYLEMVGFIEYADGCKIIIGTGDSLYSSKSFSLLMEGERYQMIKKLFLKDDKPTDEEITVFKQFVDEQRNVTGIWIEYTPLKLIARRFCEPTRYELICGTMIIQLDKQFKPFFERLFFILEKINEIDLKYKELYDGGDLTAEQIEFLKTCQ